MKVVGEKDKGIESDTVKVEGSTKDPTDEVVDARRGGEKKPSLNGAIGDEIKSLRLEHSKRSCHIGMLWQDECRIFISTDSSD